MGKNKEYTLSYYHRHREVELEKSKQRCREAYKDEEKRRTYIERSKQYYRDHKQEQHEYLRGLRKGIRRKVKFEVGMKQFILMGIDGAELSPYIAKKLEVYLNVVFDEFSWVEFEEKIRGWVVTANRAEKANLSYSSVEPQKEGFYAVIEDEQGNTLRACLEPIKGVFWGNGKKQDI